ncbi:MAG: extracellular solute-binding protein [Rickettsiales bacterium]
MAKARDGLRIFGFGLFASCFLLSNSAISAPSYCISLYDECKYKEGFTHFEYVNPAAPKRGEVRLVETGTFDNLNPFLLKGVKAPAIDIIFDTLMVASKDEPQTMYGLIAQTVDVADDNSYAEFVLNNKARFRDGSQIVADDVVFSFNSLVEKGSPVYKIMFAGVKEVKKIADDKVRFVFSDTQNKELPVLVASLPILSKKYYQKVDFEKTTLDSPLGSGAYKVKNVEQGKSITYERVEDYWAKDLPVNKGQYNFDIIRYDMYRDENVSLEALKAGAYDFRREYIARNWATAYDAPAIKDGRIIKKEIPDNTPQGMQAFVFNTRHDKFSDRRVREAIGLSLDYEWVNKTIFYGAYVRNKSFFENTEFESQGVPKEKELELLEPFKNKLPPDLFTKPFANPATDGSGNARKNLVKAKELLEQAGWTVKDGKRVNSKGELLTIEVMLRQPTMERVIAPMKKNLERLGIDTKIRMVDDAQYQKRLDESDFDIVSIWINRGIFFPGNEQVSLWHSTQADIKGSNNLAGLKNKVVDSLLDNLISAKDKESFVAYGRALDRVLLWEHVVIPHWHSNSYRVAYWDKFAMPKITPKYDMGFFTWWIKEEK